MAQNQVSQRVNSPVMTVGEVCEYLRIHRSTLYRLIKSGHLPHFRLGSDYRFNRKRLLCGAKTDANTSPAPKPPL